MPDHRIAGNWPRWIRVGNGGLLAPPVKQIRVGTGSNNVQVWPSKFKNNRDRPPFFYYDNFDRPDGPLDGAEYVRRQTWPVVRNGALSMPAPGNNQRLSGNATYRWPCPTDNVYAGVRLGTKPFVDQRAGIQISSSLDDNGGDPTNYVGLEFGERYILLFTRINGGYNNRMTKTNLTLKEGDIIEFERGGDWFACDVNGVQQMVFNGDNQGIAKGAFNRYVGFGQVSQYPFFQQPYYSSNFTEAWAFSS